MSAISVSLVSHTNVGKTTLMRTLLREDVGEVADRPHVTEAAEVGVLVETPEGDVLRLWDTPGLGDSARLLKRLRAAENPLGWLLAQVWDRFTDRPFFSSQQALKNVRDEADVVLYLVNAAEDPASSAYVPIELEILGWIGRPVILLLNQSGPPRSREVEAAEEEAWRASVASFPQIRGALTLDAFARCWVQEERLFSVLGSALAGETAPALQRLRAAWREKNIEVFDTSVDALADELAAVLIDREPLASAGDESRAIGALAARAQAAARKATERLIAAHGLAGHAREEIPRRVAEQFDVRRPADVAKAGLLGGVVSGLLGGLKADLASGGASLGAGAIIGALVGALGAGGVAHLWNVVRGKDAARARWSLELLEAHLAGAVLRYLAVAHFGRGRGEWRESEHPPHWRALAEEIARAHRDALEFLSGESAPDARPLVREALSAALVRLYPDAAPQFMEAARQVAASDRFDEIALSNAIDKGHVPSLYTRYTCPSCREQVSFSRTDFQERGRQRSSNLSSTHSAAIAAFAAAFGFGDSEYLDWYCPGCRLPVRAYFRQWAGGRHGDSGVDIIGVVELAPSQAIKVAVPERAVNGS